MSIMNLRASSLITNFLVIGIFALLALGAGLYIMLSGGNVFNVFGFLSTQSQPTGEEGDAALCNNYCATLRVQQPSAAKVTSYQYCTYKCYDKGYECVYKGVDGSTYCKGIQCFDDTDCDAGKTCTASHECA